MVAHFATFLSVVQIQSTTMSLPPTPIHPAPNEEVKVELPTEKFDDADFDLNPDLYDEDDLEVKGDTNRNDNANGVGIGNGNGNGHSNGIDNETVQENGNDYEAHPVNDDDIIDDSNSYLQSVTTPFDEAYDASLKEFTSPILLSELQISKLINYLDDNLLQVRRKYIKTHIEGESQYSLLELFHDLSLLVDIMWKPILNRNTLCGQPDYFIRILNDCEDYLNYYEIFTIDNINSFIHQFFAFWQSLDLKISLLIDGYTSFQGVQKLNQTHLIRLLPIVTRLRIMIITKLETFKITLTQENHRIRNILEVEIGRLFEGILDRQ